MLRILQLIFARCELAIRHDAVNGLTAGASGPFAVLALMIIVITLAAIFGGH